MKIYQLKFYPIEDFQTFGLKVIGVDQLWSQDKNFYSLVLDFTEVISGDTLGSYGAEINFSKYSALKTAVYYSSINKEDSPDNDYSRAIAKGLFRNF